MPKFFLNNENITNNEIQITKDNAKHIIKVLRKKVGDIITVSDGNKKDYECKITDINNKLLIINCIVISEEENNSELKPKITLFQGIPKNDKLDLIIQKSVELGVFKIIPLETEFTISNNISKKIERFNKISESAAKQSGRGIIPKVCESVKLKNLDLNEYTKIFVCYEKSETNPKLVLNNFDENENIAIFIGPEGGFSKSEIEFLEKNNVKTVSLGKRILRTETAGIVFLSILIYELGGL